MNNIPWLVVLDRDGVINEDSDEFIKSADEWVPITGSLEAIARLNHAGVVVTVATNQSGVGRGLLTLDDLNLIHAKLQSELARVGGHIDGIFFCPHAPQAHCGCRKPAPGLLQAIGGRFGRRLDGIPCIGDSKRDLDAALAVGARPMLVRTGKGARMLASHPELEAFPVYDDLAAAVDDLLTRDLHA